jgi:hypothetical protein
MKQCPKCRRTYSDEYLYCEEDATVLNLVPKSPKKAGVPHRGKVLVGVGLATLVVLWLVCSRRDTPLVVEQTPSPEATAQPSEASSEATPTPGSEVGNQASEPLPGEKYPQTRQRSLSQEEIEQMGYSTVRYAINEIYARRGYRFDNGPIRRHFEQMSWYQPREDMTMEQLETTIPDLEMNNAKQLSAWKQTLTERGQAIE